MKYITIDGDDIGQKIQACYLNNDSNALSKLNNFIQNRVKYIAEFLREEGFTIIFCAADGVAAWIESYANPDNYLYEGIGDRSGGQVTFSAGVGEDLRESYVALLAAKSNGKARLCNYRDLK